LKGKLVLPKVICDTSVIQYLHQLELLHILPALAEGVIIPPAVEDELATGKALGVNLPDLSGLDWVSVRRPVSVAALPLVTDLGPGETQVLMLALELPQAVVVLDDALARRVAQTLGLRLTGTLGLLVDAKRADLISAVEPFLDRLQALRFRLAPHTRNAVLKLAGEGA
jgi:predicted nucleic acid-binding protein